MLHMQRPPEENSSLEYTLIQGDATNRGLLSKNSVDLTVTSPPYNVGKAYIGDTKDDALNYNEYLKFSKKWLSNAYYWTKQTGRLCLNVGLDMSKNGKRPICSDLTSVAMCAGWKYHATIIWNEGNISRRTAWGSWKSASAPHVIAPVEVIIVLYKGEWKKSRKGENDITADEFKNWVLEYGGLMEKVLNGLDMRHHFQGNYPSDVSSFFLILVMLYWTHFWVAVQQ